ncbi:hypothetical protein [Celeribacter halophilus]|uniref:hypothetical protein n=1 Tax=Celeribacter halophilus TaxID=576117 RepID=UPI003A9384BA
MSERFSGVLGTTFFAGFSLFYKLFGEGKEKSATAFSSIEAFIFCRNMALSKF